MTLSGAGTVAATTNVAADQMSVAVARKALDHQRVQGEAAVGLIQQAGAVTQVAASGKGSLVDTMA